MAIVDPLTRVKDYAPTKADYVLGKGLIEPYNNHNAASRKKMFNVHLDHKTPVLNAEIAFCDTGYANEYGRYSSSVIVSDMDYEIIAKISKFSHLPDHDYILVLKNPISKSYTIHHKVNYNYLTETNGYLYNNDYVNSKQVGDIIKQGDIIRTSDSFDEFGNKMDGVNIRGAFLNIAETCEDGILLSESVRYKFDSPVFKPKRMNINTNNIPLNLYGEPGNYKVCPFIGERVKNGILMGTRLRKNDEQFYSESQDKLRKLMTSDKQITIGDGILIDYDIYCNDPEKLFTDQKYAQFAMMYMNQRRFSEEIVSVLEPIVKDPQNNRSYELEELYIYHKRITNGELFLNEKDTAFSFLVIDFMVYDVSRIQIGDKITNRYGGKGVVAGFLPEERMPLLDNGKRLEAIWNSAGIVGRLNAGQEIEQETNMISSRIIERIRSGLFSMDECFEMYLDFLSFVSPKQCKEVQRMINNMTNDDKRIFLDSIKSYDCIHFTIEPITESYGIDLLSKMYDHFDWIEPYTVMVAQRTSNGGYRQVKTRRTLVAGHIYMYRLKQHAEEKFSVTSLSATNIRGLNTRSRSGKLYESPFSRTPVQLGNMENYDLIHTDAELVLMNLLLNSASVHGRRLAKALLTDNPYDVDIKPDSETDNINARIMHVYLKASGLRMIFEKQLIQKIIPAMIVPAINTRHKVNNMNGTIVPANIMLEQEKLLYGNCIKPAIIVPNNIPAHFIPAYIHERYNFDERRD